MLDAIRTFFRSSMAPTDAASDATPGTGGGTEPDLRLAACALLLELAHADSEFSDDEREHVESAIRRHFGVEPDQAERLIELAEAERRQAVDLWQFTNLIDQSYSLGQKTVLAEIMWGLVYSDGDLAEKESYLMRKISNLLHLQPGYLAEARKRVEARKKVDRID